MTHALRFTNSNPGPFAARVARCLVVGLLAAACHERNAPGRESQAPQGSSLMRVDGHPNVRAAYVLTRQAEGREQRAYHVHEADGTFRAHSPAHGFESRFGDGV